MFHKILTPFDGSLPSEEACALALEFAEKHGCEVVVLFVARPPEARTGTNMTSLLAIAQEHCKTRFESMKRHTADLKVVLTFKSVTLRRPSWRSLNAIRSFSSSWGAGVRRRRDAGPWERSPIACSRTRLAPSSRLDDVCKRCPSGTSAHRYRGSGNLLTRAPSSNGAGIRHRWLLGICDAVPIVCSTSFGDDPQERSPSALDTCGLDCRGAVHEQIVIYQGLRVLEMSDQTIPYLLVKEFVRAREQRDKTPNDGPRIDPEPGCKSNAACGNGNGRIVVLHKVRK